MDEQEHRELCLQFYLQHEQQQQHQNQHQQQQQQYQVGDIEEYADENGTAYYYSATLDHHTTYNRAELEALWKDRVRSQMKQEESCTSTVDGGGGDSNASNGGEDNKIEELLDDEGKVFYFHPLTLRYPLPSFLPSSLLSLCYVIVAVNRITTFSHLSACRSTIFVTAKHDTLVCRSRIIT